VPVLLGREGLARGSLGLPVYVPTGSWLAVSQSAALSTSYCSHRHGDNDGGLINVS